VNHPRGCLSGDCECDDLVIDYDRVQMTGSMADECIAAATASPTAGNEPTCATGIPSCQDGPGLTCAFSQQTTCYPDASCGPCRDACADFGSGSAADDCYGCLQGQLATELGSGTAPTMPGACTLIFDATGDMCIAGSAALDGAGSATLMLLPCTQVLGVDGLSMMFGQSVVAGTTGALGVSVFQVPFTMSPPSTSSACSITFFQPATVQAMPASGSADFMAKVMAPTDDLLELPIRLFVTQLGGPCTTDANSTCDSQFTGSAYGTCAD
jgi:hypothetical protein